MKAPNRRLQPVDRGRVRSLGFFVFALAIRGQFPDHLGLMLRHSFKLKLRALCVTELIMKAPGKIFDFDFG